MSHLVLGCKRPVISLTFSFKKGDYFPCLGKVCTCFCMCVIYPLVECGLFFHFSPPFANWQVRPPMHGVPSMGMMGSQIRPGGVPSSAVHQQRPIQAVSGIRPQNAPNNMAAVPQVFLGLSLSLCSVWVLYHCFCLEGNLNSLLSFISYSLIYCWHFLVDKVRTLMTLYSVVCNGCDVEMDLHFLSEIYRDSYQMQSLRIEFWRKVLLVDQNKRLSALTVYKMVSVDSSFILFVAQTSLQFTLL